MLVEQRRGPDHELKYNRVLSLVNQQVSFSGGVDDPLVFERHLLSGAAWSLGAYPF